MYKKKKRFNMILYIMQFIILRFSRLSNIALYTLRSGKNINLFFFLIILNSGGIILEILTECLNHKMVYHFAMFIILSPSSSVCYMVNFAYKELVYYEFSVKTNIFHDPKIR